MVTIMCLYNMNYSTTGIILKNRHKTMEHAKSTVPAKSTIMFREHGFVVEEMEKLLGAWMG